MQNLSQWGVDLGGTKIEGAIMDPSNPGRALYRLRRETGAALGYDHILSQIAGLISDLESAAGVSRQQKRKHNIKNETTISEIKRPQKIRRSYNRITQVSLGEEALEARAQWLAATRSSRGWLATFVEERYQVEDMNSDAAKAGGGAEGGERR